MRKLIKLTRHLRARLKPSSSIPVFWHIGRPNFGDDINPDFFSMLAGDSVRLATNRNQPHFLGIGSILESSKKNSIVLGSGLLAPPVHHIEYGKVISVRGELTRKSLGSDLSMLLGDPLVLIDEVLPRTGLKTDIIGFVPHINELKKAKALKIPNIKIIDVSKRPIDVVREIGSCAKIYSQSLHGLIVADAFQVPNVWIAPSAGMLGGEFKFKDYFSTLDDEKIPQPFCLNTFLEGAGHLFKVGTFKYNKKHYLEALVDGLHELNFKSIRQNI